MVPRLKEKVTGFKAVMPCITSLRNPSLKARHWDQIENIIQRSIARDKHFTLGNLLEMNVSFQLLILKGSKKFEVYAKVLFYSNSWQKNTSVYVPEQTNQ